MINRVNYNSPIFGYKSSFSKNLERVMSQKNPSKEDLQELSNQFYKDIYPKKENNKHWLGSGAFNDVFKIDDYYVLRVPQIRTPDDKTIKKYKANEKFKTLKTYYGEPVAQAEDMEILKNATPSWRKSTPVTSVFSDDGKRIGEERYYKEIYLPRFSALPQKSFDNIAIDIATLRDKSTKIHYDFDFRNPANFIKSGNSIRIVDEISGINMDGLDDFCIEENMGLNKLLAVFIRQDGSFSGFNNIELTTKEAKMEKNIFQKCMLAAERAGLSYEGLKDHNSFYNQELKSIGITLNSEVIYNDIEKIRKIYPEINSRIKELGKYLDIILEMPSSVDSYRKYLKKLHGVKKLSEKVLDIRG